MIDLYTKAVLTVIAVCLVVICVRDIRFVGEAQAQNSSAVRIEEWNGGITFYISMSKQLEIWKSGF